MANPNCCYVESDYGAHCDFFSTVVENGEKTHKRLYTDLVLKYLADLREYDNDKVASSTN